MGFLFQAVGMGNVDKKCLLVGAWMPLMGGLASPRTSRVGLLLLSALFCVIRVRNAKGNTVRRDPNSGQWQSRHIHSTEDYKAQCSAIDVLYLYVLQVPRVRPLVSRMHDE